jgi:hypothetical protein
VLGHKGHVSYLRMIIFDRGADMIPVMSLSISLGWKLMVLIRIRLRHTPDVYGTNVLPRLYAIIRTRA